MDRVILADCAQDVRLGGARALAVLSLRRHRARAAARDRRAASRWSASTSSEPRSPWAWCSAYFLGLVEARDRRHLVEWTTDLRLLDFEEFEWFVGELYRRKGWSVERVGRRAAARRRRRPPP